MKPRNLTMLMSCAWQTSLDRQAALVGYSNLGRRKAFDLRTRNKRADKARKIEIHPSAQTEGSNHWIRHQGSGSFASFFRRPKSVAIAISVPTCSSR